MLQFNFITIMFLAIISIEIILIIYFNISAGLNYSKSLEVDVRSNSQVCNYNNIPKINKNNICKNDNSYYFVSENKISYKLSETSKYYLNVCNNICGGGTLTNGNCSQNGNPVDFDKCISDLEPQAGCKNGAVPLVYDENNGNKIYYYAKSVINANNPCN